MVLKIVLTVCGLIGGTAAFIVIHVSEQHPAPPAPAPQVLRATTQKELDTLSSMQTVAPHHMGAMH